MSEFIQEETARLATEDALKEKSKLWKECVSLESQLEKAKIATHRASDKAARECATTDNLVEAVMR